MADALPPESLTAREAVLTRRIQVWGGGVLTLVAAAGLAAAFGLAAVAPGAIFAIPLVVAAAIGMVTVLRSPGWGAATSVVLSLLLSGVADDLPAGKVIYGGYLAVFLVAWHVPRWASGERLVASRTDAGAVLLIVLGIGLGLVLGVLFRNPVSEIVTQIQAFVPVLLYFPIKQTCARERLGPELMAGALIVLGIVAAAENVVLTRQALQDATKLYEIIDVRVSYGEIMMMSATVLTAGLLMSTRTWTGFASALPLFGIAVAGLILSKSRGFWVATILALAILFVMSRSQQRRRLASAGVVGLGALLVVAFAVAPQYVMLIGTGIAKRFLTLSTAATADMSLINRFAENAGAWQVIRQNPVIGHGWGATYSYYSLLSQGSQVWGFVHNAYFGVWLKLGLWGLALVVWVWVGSAACGVLAVRDRWLSERHRALAGAAGAALIGIALVAYASSPFELADQMTVLTALWAVAQGTAQQVRDSDQAAA